MAIRFLADMNISPVSVASLRQLGWDIVRISEILPHNTPDLEILGWAREKERVIVTQDLDFSMLLALGGHSQPSLITLRLGNSDPQTVTNSLLEILPEIEAELLSGCAITITENAIRIRQLPIE